MKSIPTLTGRITFSCAMICISSLLVVSCGKRSRSESPRAVLEKNIQIMDEFSASMERAGNADQVVAALDRYTREINALLPKIEALQEDHPELGEIDRTGAFPEEYKDLESAFSAMGMKMMRAMAKAMEYGEDPRVQAALENMFEAAHPAP